MLLYLTEEDVVAEKKGTKTAPDLHGQVALMLCESMLHALVEAGVLSKELAIGAIDTVAELTRETLDTSISSRSTSAGDRGQARAALALVNSIRTSFLAKSSSMSQRHQSS